MVLCIVDILLIPSRKKASKPDTLVLSLDANTKYAVQKKSHLRNRSQPYYVEEVNGFILNCGYCVKYFIGCWCDLCHGVLKIF